MKTIRLNEEIFCVELIEDNEVIDSYKLEEPDCGYGGNDVIEAPAGNLFAMCFYSGESDNAFIIFSIIDNKLNVLINEDYSYGEALYMWSSDGRFFYRLVDSYERYDASDDGVYPVGRVDIFDVFAIDKKSVDLTYDFTGFDMEQIDFFEMRLIQDNEKVCVSLNGNIIELE